MAHTVDPPPLTPIEPVIEVLHGVEITDPYRWLEDQNSPRTRKWLDEQAAYTRAYFAAIPDREQIRTRITELLALKEGISEPWSVGERYFFLKREENKDQPVIVMRDGLFGPETVLVEPTQCGRGNSIAVSIVTVSADGRFLAYSVRQGGTDHSSLEILDVERGVVLPERLPEGFCTGFVFAPDGTGFYYSHRELHDARPNYRAAFWHRFGTERSRDREVFFAGEEPHLFLGILDSPGANLLAYTVFFTGKSPQTSLHLQTMSAEPSEVRLVVEGIKGCFVPFFVQGQLFACTDFAAPNFRIVRIDLAKPDHSSWHDVVPESDQRIQQFAVAADQVFVTRIDRFSTKVEVFGLDGERREKPHFPSRGTIDLLNRTNTTEKVFYSYTSISEPAAVCCYDTHRQEAVAWSEVNSPAGLPPIAIEETTYTSSDGTSVPLFLAARKELLHSGPLPTFLTGYGGFGSCVTPRFTAFAMFLMEQGFLFAVPALRGGSELGEQWHQAGKREKRQNSFNDFAAAAEWLIREHYAISGRIAIGGGSNAGLLVGAAITQRPDLFRAVICLGPLLDMSRFHLFDFAAGWEDEYGSPEDQGDFQSLLAYSPYHHVLQGVVYPAVLLISGDADTRCNPMHSRKMVARLQASTGSTHPVLLDYKTAWGHTPVQPFSTKIEALTDRIAFVCRELGVHVKPWRSL
jgi:prolyl oligopeptidase